MKERRVSTGQLVFGLALIALGLASFLDSIDLVEIGRVGRYWPLILILIGVTSEIDALQSRKGGGGYFLIAIGVWFLAGRELFGLSYRTAFPLAVVVVGAGLTLHALFDLPAKRRRELDNDGC